MRRFGLIGKTLKHSFSRTFFENKFLTEGIKDCSYENFELRSPDELSILIRDNPEIRGLNVTIPYKEQVIPYLDHKNDVVENTGACNCISVVNSELFGFNTDVIGFKSSLQSKLKPQHKSALVLGSGGASKAVQYALKESGISYTVVSRHKGFNQLGYEDLGKDCLQENKLIINTTPLGMYPAVHDDPPIPYEYLTSEHFLFDLIYNPAKTKFLEKGEQKGAQIANGYEMLVLQAEESWRIWNQEIVKH